MQSGFLNVEGNTSQPKITGKLYGVYLSASAKKSWIKGGKLTGASYGLWSDGATYYKGPNASTTMYCKSVSGVSISGFSNDSGGGTWCNYNG